jgi:fumarate hydratase subunit beta
MRDLAHKRYLEWKKAGRHIPFKLEGGVIYHCGPLVKREKDRWIVLSAGPTTSMRMDPFLPRLIKLSKAKIIIGKGGIGKETVRILMKEKAVYCEFTGGTGVLAAQAIRQVLGTYWLDLGLPEGVWVLEVEKFGPLLVTVDSSGRCLRPAQP